MMQSIQQQRAKYALEKVKQHEAQLDKEKQKEYVSHAASLPAMIHMNGLGQAAAFYRSKKKIHEQLYRLLSDWLTQAGQPFAEHQDLLDGITCSNMQTYRLAQAEAQALMDWVKKFAKAFMAGDE
jgi:CRISPR-associated protein Cmr5